MSLILVVDDMAVFREPIAASLHLSGYETVSAEDGEEALQLTLSQHPDLILLDISMPKMDGITFLRRLRSEPSASNTPVILLTAVSEKKHVLAAAAYGVKDYLLKSRFRLKDLLGRIEKLLSVPNVLEAEGGKPISVTEVTVPKAQATNARQSTYDDIRLKSHITDQSHSSIESERQTKVCSSTLAAPQQELMPATPPLPPERSANVVTPPTVTKKVPPETAIVVPGVGEKNKSPSLKRASANKASLPPLTVWPHLLTREKTMERLDTVAGGKTIAGVVAQVISVASSPNTDLCDVVRVIQSDPVLASRVLMMANSAATGSRARVSNVDDAARTIGVRGIQNMAISIGIFGTFPPNEQDGFNTMRCWQHSFAVGELMGQIMRQKNPEQEGLSHLIGLCHDLGEIMLRQHFTEEHQAILAYAIEHQLPFQKVEATALGIRHPELISRLLSKMGLPPNVVDVIREYYERQVKEHAAGISASAQLLNLTNIVAHGLQLAASTQEMVRPITRTEWRTLSSEKPPPTINPRAKRDEILTTTNMLARLPAREEHRLLTPLIERTQVRIAYVRPQTFIELDPLAFALDSICDLTIMPTLPTREQLQEFDGMVLVAIRPGVAPLVHADLSRLTVAAKKQQMPILVVVNQAGTPFPTNENLTQYVNAVRLLDLQQWLIQVTEHREEIAHLGNTASRRSLDG